MNFNGESVTHTPYNPVCVRNSVGSILVQEQWGTVWIAAQISGLIATIATK